MLNPFHCVSNGVQEEDQMDPSSLGQCSSPRRSSKKGGKSNPFSTRGLDKFNSLLADLEEKKQRVYSQMGSDLDQDNALVRFVYSSSKDDVVPIVIRLNKDGKQQPKCKSGELVKEKVKYHHSAVDHRRSVLDKSPVEPKRVTPDKDEVLVVKQEKLSDKRPTRLVGFTWEFKLKDWRRPSFYMPVAIVLILLFLVLFGRSVAILCTSIGWYLVPTLSSRKQQHQSAADRKKDFRRGTSEIKMVNNRSSPSPPRSSKSSNNNNGNGSNVKGVDNKAAGRENWHRQFDHRKSF